MLDAQVGLEHLPIIGRVAERGEEASLETPNGVARRQQIAVQLQRVDLGKMRVRQPHELILPSSKQFACSRHRIGYSKTVIRRPGSRWRNLLFCSRILSNRDNGPCEVITDWVVDLCSELRAVAAFGMPHRVDEHAAVLGA